ncbi:UDP-N-acetylmuramoyl-L-alanine--D-glutamate ligase [Piscinibacter sp. XHJ-5]|uniref:UDP-N-acetylmuramoyl-L-alanine--D-glutamate ligase n=1 Tax=Piscinibacter sp. XHJ-5 TaxID=3037797 RepID=UPI0024529841|nr:UDP-N-acetylmuramoyl-L-alanine--D-glutamate ligase [Piscinibacter sp. XHJ-5]
MNHLKDITVLVLGLGESGLAMARWSGRCGAAVRVWDSRQAPPNAAALAEHLPQAQLFTGELHDDAFDGVRLVLKSPGLAPTDARIAAALSRAADRGVLVQGELELFARALADLKEERGYAPQVVAITGTNGKTTTTAMAAMLIERTGRRVAMAGNIGPTMLQTLADALDREPMPAPVVVATVEAPVVPQAVQDAVQEAANDDLGPPMVDEAPPASQPLDDDFVPVPVVPPPPAAPVFEYLPEVWVLELSSFQLDEAKGFEPDAATVLNITQDHLDWHGSMPAYVAAKARVFGRNAVMVINRDDPQVEKLIPEPPAPAAKGKSRAPRPVERTVVRFGLDSPRRPGDYGLVVENGMAWLVRAMEADETLKRGKRAAAEDDEELHIQRLMPADALRVRGRHNAANALAALALATAIGCPLAPMLHGLREYGGEPHRVEFLGTVNGVDAFDDSKGTNVGATVAALNGLGADKAPAKLVVILGGDGKGQDFTPLADPVSRHVRAVATIGRDAALVEAALVDTGVPLLRHDTLQAATRWAFGRAHAGDAVLLSPACASLDMFRNYAHRAEVFTAEVQALAAEHGEMLS